MPVAVHKPGPLKQQNKPHKTGQHSSKRAVARELSGWFSTQCSIAALLLIVNINRVTSILNIFMPSNTG